MSTLSGAWLFRESLEDISSSINENINFSTLHLSSCTEINIYFIAQTMRIEYINPNNFVDVYQSGTGWVSPSYRFVDFGDKSQEVSDEFFNWVVANATKRNNKYNLIKALEVTTKAIRDYSNSKNNDLHTKMMSEFERDRTNILINRKRITNLEQGLPDDENYTDATVAYTKDVPSNALPYAEVKKIGGMTRKCTNLIPTDPVYGYIDSSGIYQSGTSYINQSVLDYIAVSGNVTIHTRDLMYTIAFCWYDINKDFISREQVHNTKEVTRAVPENAKYLRVFASKEDTEWSFASVELALNEGSTALPYEPYFEGLRDAKVTEMKSVGVNLIPAFNIGIDINDFTGEIRTDSSKACTDFIQINPNESYMWSGIVKTLTSCVYFYNAQKEYMGRYSSSNRDSLLVTKALLTLNLTNVGGEISYIRLWQSENVNLTGTIDMVDNSNQMLNKGSTALPYAPYMESTLPIPEAVQAIDGYGLGINADCYNYIDWEKKQFVKKVEKVDLGTLYWGYNSEGFFYSDSYVNTIIPRTALVSDYISSESTTVSSMLDKRWLVSNNGMIYIKDSSISSDSVPKGTAVFALINPVITDISDLLPEDNFIEVEGNGSITAVNEYGYDVPSEIEYQLEV